MWPRGGRLVAPILMLAETAAELDRIDAIAAEVAAIPTADGPPAAAKACLLAALALRSGGDAAPHLETVAAYGESLTGDSPSWQPRVLLIAARACVDAAVTGRGDAAVAAEYASQLCGLYLDRFRGKFGGPWSVPKRQALRMLAELDPRPGVDPAAWVAAPEISLIRRADGFPPAIWAAGDGPGEIVHRGGGERDRLFAVRPAAGDRTVAARPSVGWWEPLRVMTGGFGLQAEADRENWSVRSLARSRADGSFDKKLPADGTRYDLVQTVTADRFEAAVNGEPAWETAWGADERYAAGPLPFAALSARGDHAGSVAGLRMSGAQTVPDSVDLLPADAGRVPDWWLDGYGNENADRTTAGWRWSVGTNTLAARPERGEEGADGETLLVFPRPLAAASETVRFEFFHPAPEQPGETPPTRAGVHPALGGIAFVLTDGGVKLHRITHGPTDRTWLPADNLAEVPDARRGPAALDLAPDAWHEVALTVAGDTATAALDGETVFEHPIDPANRRTFGLFRWSGDRPVRVRNAVLTGDWADAPPAVPAAD